MRIRRIANLPDLLISNQTVTPLRVLESQLRGFGNVQGTLRGANGTIILKRGTAVLAPHQYALAARRRR